MAFFGVSVASKREARGDPAADSQLAAFCLREMVLQWRKQVGRSEAICTFYLLLWFSNLGGRTDVHLQCCQEQHAVKLLEQRCFKFILVLDLQVVCGVCNIPSLLNLHGL